MCGTFGDQELKPLRAQSCGDKKYEDPLLVFKSHNKRCQSASTPWYRDSCIFPTRDTRNHDTRDQES